MNTVTEQKNTSPRRAERSGFGRNLARRHRGNAAASGAGPVPGAALWLRRLAWLLGIWLASIVVLGVMAYGMRQLMSAAGMTSRPEAVSVWERAVPELPRIGGGGVLASVQAGANPAGVVQV